MADSEQSTRRPKKTAKRTQKALEQEGGCEEMQIRKYMLIMSVYAWCKSVNVCMYRYIYLCIKIKSRTELACDDRISDSTRRRQEVLVSSAHAGWESNV